MDREDGKIFCIISHTHWDREWYLPFEQFRIKLVDLIDNLFEILRMNPEYVFHLDSQTIVLEDYLEIRPYMRERLREYVQAGRILIGPWYVQNDFFLTSGESTIRNLMIGSRMAEEFGRCSWVGYAADQFGIISQLPQIFRGFGMDTFVFARGYNRWRKDGDDCVQYTPKTEFVWRGADGSEVDAFFMAFWYNNAQRFSRDPEKALALARKIESDFRGLTDTPYLLCMNGVDHLEAQSDLFEILGGLNERLPDGWRAEQYTFERYIEDYRAYRRRSNGSLPPLARWDGELREGAGQQILHGTLSTRSYLKRLNHEAQDLLEHVLEPLYTLVSLKSGPREYPADFLRYLWKLLIQNHAHDSICGCSTDAVHDHMEDRYARIRETGGFLLNRGLEFLALHLDRDGRDPDSYFLLVVNTLARSRSGVVELELHFPVEDGVRAFSISDSRGKPCKFEVLGYERMFRNIQSPLNLPGNLAVDSYRCLVDTGRVPGLGYTVLTVTPEKRENALFPDLQSAADPSKAAAPEAGADIVLENGQLRAAVTPEGRIDLTLKETGKTVRDVLSFDESEDCGDVYLYREGEVHERHVSTDLRPEREILEWNALVRSVRLSFEWRLPAFFDRKTGLRSVEQAVNRIELILTLRKGSPRLEADLTIENRSKDHRFRAIVRTGTASDVTLAASPFDLVKRGRMKELAAVRDTVEPFSGLLFQRDGDAGFGIFSEGIHAYEHSLDDPSCIMLTLLRGNKYIFKDFDGVNMRNDLWEVDGNQCLGTVRLKLALQPFAGIRGTGEIFRAMQDFHTPLIAHYGASDQRKFQGGRPAVQDSAISEIFYETERYPGLRLDGEDGIFEINGENILLSCLKRAENDDMIVLRVWNAGDTDESFSLKLKRPFEKAYRLDLNERIIDELGITQSALEAVSMKSREILTLGFI